MVWSEVFARCDDPSVTVRWSDLHPHTSTIRTSYQRHEDGGCANTRSTFDPTTDSWLQTTNQMRTG
jgi:hypothetical protein